MSRALLLFAMLACAATAHAQDRAPDVREMPTDWQAVDPARLAELRGGFDLPGGANISFGIERAVYINGALVVETRAHVPDLSRISAPEAEALARAMAPLVVRNGAGNAGTVSNGTAGTLTIVQNALDNQRITGLTTLSIGVGTLKEFQAINAGSTLQDALSRLSSTR